ncbi:sensor histidine kinase [Krasilnikovia cinnamomea]|uniref:sensor histidine kinase n=1 Tax=Krasilnikovia cinnamomea TaxID=349313 RepID=UPI001A93A574|nr:histidine kinase [Krasilnikovia cinnamomea]
MRWALPAAVSSLLAGRVVRRVWPAVAVFAATIAVGVAILVVVPALLAQAGTLIAVWVGAGLLPWLVGVVWRQGAELVRAGWSRAEQLEREQRLTAEQVRLRERARIAQDMHDSLGHELSLIALRAGALKVSPDLAETHRDAAEQVRAGLADAVDRLGEIVGVLRDDAGGQQGRPVGAGPSDLVQRAAAAGVTVRLTQSGTPSPTASAMHDHAVYRVVQEALTNATRHAPGSAVEVVVTSEPTQSVLRVVNALVPGAPAAGASHGSGLPGLRERVRLAGGTFEAGRRADRWEVVARIPHAAAVEVAAPPTATAVRRRHRRRVSRTAVAVFLVPTLAYAALVAAVGLWRHQVVNRAVLTADAYASLQIGQRRTQVAPLLPRRQAPHPRGIAAAPGVVCEYYAMTSDPFDDRSGDAYRLCFREGVLVTLDTLRS